MKNAEKRAFFERNPFADAFAQFDEETFFDNLHNQVRNKPYFEKYSGFKSTLLALSYLFNLASALTASYAIFWLTNWITGVAVVGYIVAAIFLFFLEKVKRKSSTEFWQVYFFRKQLAIGWLVLSLFCLFISLASSGFGVKQGTETLSPSPELLKADSMANYYAMEIRRLEGVNTELRANKNQDGQTFYKLYNSINANTATIADYRKRAQELEQQLEGKNEQLTASYKHDVHLTAWTLVWITLLMEVLFEGCIAYVWYYYYRSYVERLGVHKIFNVHTNNVQNVDNKPTMSLSELQTTILLLQAENEVLRAEESISPVSSDEFSYETSSSFNSERGHVSTHEDTENEFIVDDRYTVPHTYQKGGKSITVHYNATMVKSRVGEYERKIIEAKEKGMNRDIIENREQWLRYWLNKEEELKHKLVES